MQRDGTRAAWGFLLPLALAVGVLVLAGTTSIAAHPKGDESKQLIFAAIGIGALLLAQATDYRGLIVISPVLFAASLLPVLYTVAGRFGSVPLVHEVNGAHAWIFLGPISLQPAEITKICLVLLLAWSLKPDTPERSLWVLARTLLILAIAAGPILLQPDLGTVLTLVPPTAVMLFAAGVRKRHLLGLVSTGLIAAPLLWFSGPTANVPVLRSFPEFVKPYQRERVAAMFSNDPSVMQVKGYQQQRALEAMGSGGVWGKGRGNVPVGQFVPESHTDMIIALIGEQFGAIGTGAIVLCYGLIFGVGVAIASEQRELPAKLLALGLATLLVGQAILNLAVAMRLMPVTGVTLPFVSYGGSSLIASFIAAGLLVNIARNQKHTRF